MIGSSSHLIESVIQTDTLTRLENRSLVCVSTKHSIIIKNTLARCENKLPVHGNSVNTNDTPIRPENRATV